MDRSQKYVALDGRQKMPSYQFSNEGCRAEFPVCFIECLFISENPKKKKINKNFLF